MAHEHDGNMVNEFDAALETDEEVQKKNQEDQLKIVYEQLKEATRISIAARTIKNPRHTGMMLCVCRNRVSIQYMYHCFHCGLWLCPKCAREHFGVRNNAPAHSSNKNNNTL